MEQDVLNELGMAERTEALAFLKRLWREQPAACPKCGETLEFMHKKAKKSNCEWKCPKCDTIYKTLRILDRLNER